MTKRAEQFSFEYLESILDPTVALYDQMHRIPSGCPLWKALATLDPVYREYIETRDRLEARYKQLLNNARRKKRQANPQCYSAAGKQIAYPHKRSSRLCALIVQLRSLREEMKANEAWYRQQPHCTARSAEGYRFA
jgi:hypothetical protein